LDPSKRLGGEDRLDELKAHPFFEGIDWEGLPNQTPPKVWIFFFSFFFFPALRNLISHNYNKNQILPYLPPTSDNPEPLRSEISTSKSAQEYVVRIFFFFFVIYRSIFILIKVFMPDDEEQVKSKRTSSDQSKWSQFLLANETIIMLAPVNKRKGLFSKRRQLILTDLPRLIYIDEEKVNFFLFPFIFKKKIKWNWS